MRLKQNNISETVTNISMDIMLNDIKEEMKGIELENNYRKRSVSNHRP
jgi:hypothetical protein